MEQIYYFDNAATTMMYPEVVESMKPYFSEFYGNPSSLYGVAQEAKKAVENSRFKIAQMIGAKKSEIYFTSGGSESDNWAIRMVAEQYKEKGKHIITSKIEHHAVLYTCKYLESFGYEISYLDVNSDGEVSLEQLEAAVRPDTILISIMTANNEIGTIQPIKEIGTIAHRHGILFHTDAVQAVGHLKLDVNELNVDLLSASGHKFHGPKGTGFLYIKDDVKKSSLIFGGGQEKGKRAGTLNVPGIVGMATALELIHQRNTDAYEQSLRDYLIKCIMEEIPYTRVNGSLDHRLSNNANFSFQYISGESLLIMLDMEGICASSGSACAAGSSEASHVLEAICCPKELIHGSLRLTISSFTTKDEVDYVIQKLKDIINQLRSMSAQYMELER